MQRREEVTHDTGPLSMALPEDGMKRHAGKAQASSQSLADQEGQYTQMTLQNPHDTRRIPPTQCLPSRVISALKPSFTRAPLPPPKAYTKHPNEAIKMDPANSRSRRDKRYRIIERAEKRVQGVQTGPPTTRSPIETTPTLFSLLRSPLPRRTPREASFAPGFKGRERYKFMQRRVPRGNIYNRDPPASMNF